MANLLCPNTCGETFKVDTSNTKKLLEGVGGQKIREKDIIVVGESGIFTPYDIAYVQEAGVKAFYDQRLLMSINMLLSGDVSWALVNARSSRVGCDVKELSKKEK
ncbi:hypothetical protein POM88_024918 [Heracleum sosnowskyi]|uniref:Uncharacterized protein n=1 Tax=Heracleum sosnowskyi TaxID=360622 RepID=A0AAD8I2Y8_9APIA|nr:hypothetical protein POM88_024918 [Heracleum sosnowskyi]